LGTAVIGAIAPGNPREAGEVLIVKEEHLCRDRSATSGMKGKTFTDSFQEKQSRAAAGA
jgi:hypothetical protein